jgi:hypothetical protein
MAVPRLLIDNIPNDRFLGNKIAGYEYRTKSFVSDYYRPTSNDSLTAFKAWDAVKDGASKDLAYKAFGVNQDRITQSDCKSLPEIIKAHFEQKVTTGEIRCLTYTRRKGSELNVFDDNNEINATYGIPDCGPNYSKADGKTPVIRSLGGDVMKLLYSLGNVLDTGPSSKNTINLKCDDEFEINNSIFSSLGYGDINKMFVRKSRDKPDFDLFIDGDSAGDRTHELHYTEFKDTATGNANKKHLIEEHSSLTLENKKILLYLKSLGDTLIVYFWLWGCLSTDINTSIALLTCDTVVALQADIFSQGVNNAYWVLNHNEKGEKHISRVYAKTSLPDYKVLFKKEKKAVLKHYETEIRHFNDILNSDCEVTIGNGNIRPAISDLLHDIFYKLNDLRRSIEDLNGNDENSYRKLKLLDLLPLIRSGDTRRGYTLIRTRCKFYVADTNFLSDTKFFPGIKLTLEAIIKPYLIEYALLNQMHRGGRNVFDSNEFDAENKTEYFLQKAHRGVPNDTAITNLHDEIESIFSNLLIQNQMKFSEEYNKFLLSDDPGSIYDMLTYEFYCNPDYTKFEIGKLCQYIIDIFKQSYIYEYRYDWTKHITEMMSSSSMYRLTHSDVARGLGGSSKNRKKYIKKSTKSSKKQKTSSRRTRKRHHKIK